MMTESTIGGSEFPFFSRICYRHSSSVSEEQIGTQNRENLTKIPKNLRRNEEQ